VKLLYHMKKYYIAKLILGFCIFILTQTSEAKGAEKISFISGAFRRTVTLENIEKLSKTGVAEGFLVDIVNFSDDDPNKLSHLLNEEYELPIVLTSRLMNSRIGDAMIKRIAKIIYPLKVPKESVSVPAIRAGVIKGLDMGKGKINLFLFLKAYPNKNIAVNVPALFNVIEKVETISELVRFFSESPLNGLKEGNHKELD